MSAMKCLLIAVALFLAGCGPTPVDCSKSVAVVDIHQPEIQTVGDMKIGDTATICCVYFTRDGKAYILGLGARINEGSGFHNVITRGPDGYCVRLAWDAPESYVFAADDGDIFVKIENPEIIGHPWILGWWPWWGRGK